VSGSLFLNTFPGGGIELHGGSAFIRSVGYQGLTSASAGTSAPGFLLYSGSALPDSPDNYTGAGFEVYVTSSAFISARTDTNELNIKANRIDVGTFTATTSSVALPAGTSGGMLSSSFNTTLLFDVNRIMATSSNSAVSMSMTTDIKFLTLGNIVMTDISASALHLTASQFKVLNGTFDATKRNYVYYHYIGNDTALVTINQEQ